MSFDRPSLKEDTAEFFIKIRKSPILNEPFKDPWQLGTQLATAHRALGGAFLVHHAKIGNVAKQFGKFCQWYNELF
jgi:hypothetical protein